MLNVSSTRNKLESFAAELEERDPDTAANLRDLADALDDGPNADAWALSNVSTLINPERISNSLSRDGSADLLTRWLEVLRNSLVLLPVAVTWFGIALAVNGYYNLIKDHPERAGESFIYLWQSGFGQDWYLSLGTLALIDGFLLAMVFLLTLGAYTRSAWVSMQGRGLDERYMQSLSQTLTEAELILAPRRRPQQLALMEKIEHSAQTLMQQVATERQRLDEVTQRRERELGNLTGITTHLKGSAELFMSAAQSLATSQAATKTGIDAVSAAAGGLAAMQDRMMDAVQHVTATVDGVVQSQLKTSKATGAQMSQLLDTSASRLDGLIAEQKRGSQELTAQVAGLVTEQQRGINQLEQLTAESKSTATGMAGAFGAFSRSTRDLAGVSEILARLATEQSALIKAFQDASAAQIQVALTVSRANAGMENAVNQIEESSTTVRGVAADLTFVSQKLPELINSIHSDLGSMTLQYGDAVGAMARASANLEQAIDRIDKSLQGLQPLLDSLATNAGAASRNVDVLDKRRPTVRK